MADHRLRVTVEEFPEGVPLYVTYENGVYLLITESGEEIANATHYRLLSNYAHDKGASELRFWEDLSAPEWDLP